MERDDAGFHCNFQSPSACLSPMERGKNHTIEDTDSTVGGKQHGTVSGELLHKW
jgi:hypothetical protein